MSLDENQKQFLREAIDVCRHEVDHELSSIRYQIVTHTISEEQAEEIATRAAHKAKVMTKEELITDAKVEIGNAAINILKRATTIVALFLVGMANKYQLKTPSPLGLDQMRSSAHNEFAMFRSRPSRICGCSWRSAGSRW